MKKVCCFGELLLRMSPALDGQWISEHQMPVFIGGAELNVASALVNWNVPVRYCTALPDHYLSHEICASLAQKNIDVSKVHFAGNRIGLYYLPQGTDLKHAGVIYDRMHSSFWSLLPGDIQWEEALQEVSWLHFSAIGPALNAHAVAVCKEALETAGRMGITISVDLNYRSRLWQYGVAPADVMPGLVQHAQVIMGNIWSANSLLGIPLQAQLLQDGTKEAYLAHARFTAGQLLERFPACKIVANTFRFDTPAGGILYYASLQQQQTHYCSPEFTTGSLVDKVGSGDCFMGGLIYGLYHQHPYQQVINYAAAAAFGKLQEKGDATHQTISSVQSIIQSYE